MRKGHVVRRGRDLKMWIETSEKLSPEYLVVFTKIDDNHGCRNIQKLKRVKSLWFTPNGNMYVYYKPTHWRYAF